MGKGGSKWSQICYNQNHHLYSYFLNREEEKELPENSKESLEEITNKSKKTEGSIFIYEKPKILNQIGMQKKKLRHNRYSKRC